MVDDYCGWGEAPVGAQQSKYIREIAEVALRADEDGEPEIAAALIQIVTVAGHHLPRETIQRLINTGYLIVDAVDCAARLSGRRRER